MTWGSRGCPLLPLGILVLSHQSRYLPPEKRDESPSVWSRFQNPHIINVPRYFTKITGLIGSKQSSLRESSIFCFSEHFGLYSWHLAWVAISSPTQDGEARRADVADQRASVLDGLPSLPWQLALPDTSRLHYGLFRSERRTPRPLRSSLVWLGYNYMDNYPMDAVHCQVLCGYVYLAFKSLSCVKPVTRLAKFRTYFIFRDVEWSSGYNHSDVSR